MSAIPAGFSLHAVNTKVSGVDCTAPGIHFHNKAFSSFVSLIYDQFPQTFGYPSYALISGFIKRAT